MRSTRGRLGWVLAAVVLITACGGGTSGGGTPAPSKTTRIGSFDRPIVFAFTPSQDVARITASNSVLSAGF